MELEIFKLLVVEWFDQDDIRTAEADVKVSIYEELVPLKTVNKTCLNVHDVGLINESFIWNSLNHMHIQVCAFKFRLKRIPMIYQLSW